MCHFRTQAENAHTGRQLQARLEAAGEAGGAINEEERLFGWECSDYPQVRHAVQCVRGGAVLCTVLRVGYSGAACDGPT